MNSTDSSVDSADMLVYFRECDGVVMRLFLIITVVIVVTIVVAR